MGFSRRISCLAFAAATAFICAPRSCAAGPWEGPASELAEKIVSRIAPGATLWLEVRNESSLGANEVSEITRILRAELSDRGARLFKTTQPSEQVGVTLSENLEGLLWVAEIRHAGSPPAPSPRDVVMIQVARPRAENLPAPSETLALRKTLLYEQRVGILDLALLEGTEAAEPLLLVFDTERVALYKKQATNWVIEQSLPVTRSRPWPRDARGRLTVRAGGSFDAYAPGTRCAGETLPALSMECHDSNDPWPLSSAASAQVAGHFSADRNFFDGPLSISGEKASVAPFYSAAIVADPSGPMEILAGLDGSARLFRKGAEPLATLAGWGSDIAALQSGCGSGWQILATRAGDLTEADSIHAYSIRDGALAEASAPAEFPGPVTALWPAERGRTALAVTRDLKRGEYEAFTLSISCGR